MRQGTLVGTRMVGARGQLPSERRARRCVTRATETMPRRPAEYATRLFRRVLVGRWELGRR